MIERMQIYENNSTVIDSMNDIGRGGGGGGGESYYPILATNLPWKSWDTAIKIKSGLISS